MAHSVFSHLELMKELISMIHNMIELLKIEYLGEKQAIYRQKYKGSATRDATLDPNRVLDR